MVIFTMCDIPRRSHEVLLVTVVIMIRERDQVQIVHPVSGVSCSLITDDTWEFPTTGARHSPAPGHTNRCCVINSKQTLTLRCWDGHLVL